MRREGQQTPQWVGCSAAGLHEDQLEGDITETEWLECTDPASMLKFLDGKVSQRKLRLYLCGGCRHITHRFYRPESLTAVEVAERFADGDATEDEIGQAAMDAVSPTSCNQFDNEWWPSSDPNRMSIVPRLV